ncbi:phage major capsid protein [Lelliottia wanjuensis]|uniref:phage major capsid protein n=1 Tax=Lelliottia wanjuensis TaxID=3050585 RepID=UPI00254A92CA|nr:phage major capsid protein [Lelliottia sp. V106_16]MDK9356715.1 phage major capsid protein [Lelliottia sp. V106_16]
MQKLIELRRKKSELATQLRSILEKADTEKRSLTAEERTQFDELKKEAEELRADIERYEVTLEDERRDAGKGAKENRTDAPTNEELRSYIMTGDTRSMSTTVPADGGYTVIPELDTQVMRILQDDSEMRAICTVKKISSNEYKKLVSVGGATVNHRKEGDDVTETSTPELEEVSIKIYPIYAYPKTTQEILDFSDIDIMQWLSEEIGDKFVETEETDLVNGTGTNQSKGLLVYTRDTKDDKTRAFGTLQKMVAASATAVTADELIDFRATLRKKYRKNAVWVMNSTTAAQLQKLKNDIGDYIWRDSLKAGDPDMLLGRPVIYVETMPNMSGGNASIAFGDFKRGYYIIDHETGVRTRPDNITEPGFYKVYTAKYLGGGVVDSSAIKLLEMAPGASS